MTAFESFRRKNVEKNEIDSETACSEDSDSLYKIKIKGLGQSYREKRGMLPLSLCLNEFGGTYSQAASKSGQTAILFCWSAAQRTTEMLADQIPLVRC